MILMVHEELKRFVVYWVSLRSGDRCTGKIMMKNS